MNQSEYHIDQRSIRIDRQNYNRRQNYNQDSNYFRVKNNYEAKDIQSFTSLLKKKQKTAQSQFKKDNFVEQSKQPQNLLPSTRILRVKPDFLTGHYTEQRINKQRNDYILERYMKRQPIKNSLIENKQFNRYQRNNYQNTKKYNNQYRNVQDKNSKNKQETFDQSPKVNKNQQQQLSIMKNNNMKDSFKSQNLSFNQQQIQQEIIYIDEKDEKSNESSEWLQKKDNLFEQQQQQIQSILNDDSHESEILKNEINNLSLQDKQQIIKQTISFDTIKQNIQKLLVNNYKSKICIQMKFINISKFKIKQIYLIQIGTTLKIEEKCIKYKFFPNQTDYLKQIISINQDGNNFALAHNHYNQKPKYFQFGQILSTQQIQQQQDNNSFIINPNKKKIKSLINNKILQIKLVEVTCSNCYSSLDVVVANNSIHLSCQSTKDCSQKIQAQIVKLQIK